jgi:hypothetical protein
MGQDTVEILNRTFHFDHYFILGSIQVKTLQYQKSHILAETFLQMTTEYAEQRLLRNGLSLHLLKLRHQLFAASQQTHPSFLVF